jgi:hypothetical protein
MVRQNIRRCRCQAAHRSYTTFAECAWKKAEWVIGDGAFAVLAHCRVLTVTLHKTREKAEESQRFIDKFGCGGMCGRRHEIVQIHLPKKEPASRSVGQAGPMDDVQITSGQGETR